MDDIVYTIMLHGRQMSEEVKVNPDDDELPARAHAHARAHTHTPAHARAHTPARTHASAHARAHPRARAHAPAHTRARTRARTRIQVNPAKWYLIVPCAVRAGVEGTFWVRVTSSQPFSFKPLREYTPSAAEQDAMRRCAPPPRPLLRRSATLHHTAHRPATPAAEQEAMRKCAVAEDRPAVALGRLPTAD